MRKAGPLRLLLLIGFALISPALQAQQPGNDAVGGSTGKENLLEPPLLCGILDLDSLSLLEQGPGFAAEPLDIAFGAEGPVLLFADRYLSLGPNLEVDQRTVKDLNLAPALPAGFIPSRLFLNPLGEPLLLSSDGSELLLFPSGAELAQRFHTGESQPLAAAALARGGLALLRSEELLLYTRSVDALNQQRVPLSPGFFTALDADIQDRLWAYDIGTRIIRVFDREGNTVHTIAPAIKTDGSAVLLFPQVFRVRPDGSFFLGGSGELWCFEPDGAPRWRLTQFTARYRQSLPAFFLVASACRPEDRSFYLLDPLGRRVFKFTEGGAVGQQAQSIDKILSEALQGPAASAGELERLVQLCLERGLLLQADSIMKLYGEKLTNLDLTAAMLEKRARLLSELAAGLEARLQLPEAQEAYNRSLTLYRELRRDDPVDSRYPEAVRALIDRRNTVRDALLVEQLLTAELVSGPAGFGGSSSETAMPGGQPDGGTGLRLTFLNRSVVSLEQVEVEARFSGLQESRWTGSIRRLSPGGKLAVSLPFSGIGAGQTSAEDLLLTLNVVVKFLHDRKVRLEYFRYALLYPAGALRLPSLPCAQLSDAGTSQR